jgi:hypothetical protein
LTALMAREMGGGVRAQVLAGAAQFPYALGAGAFMMYVSAGRSSTRICSGEDPVSGEGNNRRDVCTERRLGQHWLLREI